MTEGRGKVEKVWYELEPRGFVWRKRSALSGMYEPSAPHRIESAGDGRRDLVPTQAAVNRLIAVRFESMAVRSLVVG